MSAFEYDDASAMPRIARVITRLREAQAVSRTRSRTPELSDAGPVKASGPDPRLSPDYWPLPGLAPMTRVRTSFGDVHAVALRKGDRVKVRTGEFVPIVWINRVLLDERFLSEKLDANPILIQAGSLGAALPAVDVLVSPRQVICPTPGSVVSQPREAGDMLRRPGVGRLRETGLSYTMFHVGHPAEVMCEGMFLDFTPPSAH